MRHFKFTTESIPEVEEIARHEAISTFMDIAHYEPAEWGRIFTFLEVYASHVLAVLAANLGQTSNEHQRGLNLIFKSINKEYLQIEKIIEAGKFLTMEELHESAGETGH